MFKGEVDEIPNIGHTKGFRSPHNVGEVVFPSEYKRES